MCRDCGLRSALLHYRHKVVNGMKGFDILFDFFIRDHTTFKDFIVAKCVYGDGCDYLCSLSVDRDSRDASVFNCEVTIKADLDYESFVNYDGCNITLRCEDDTNANCVFNFFDQLRDSVDDFIKDSISGGTSAFLPIHECGDNFIDSYYCIHDISYDDYDYGDNVREVTIYKVCWPDRTEMIIQLTT